MRPPSAEPAPWVADLHIHSKYSRACSRDLELPNLAWWAQRKGITLVGTGDFTHPAWFDHCREHLRPAEPGLYRLTAEVEAEVARRLPPRVHAPVRFMLSVEISTIYKHDDRTRKVHHLIYLPDLDAVARFNARLGHGPGGFGGNLGSDGRPILGLDSRDLLEIVLEASPDGFLVPAHIWTPWFSVLGSKSGFDAVADCYRDLAGHIHAVETGLSSDPAMNWRVASLDRYQLVSSSDAHSPPALGREATCLTTDLDYHAVKRALETGAGLHSTIEFFPEEGKYHADGHRACGVCWDPPRTRAAGGLCPECAKPLTVGVQHRVDELADRPVGWRPEDRPGVRHLIQMHEVLAEIHDVGARSKAVAGRIAALVAVLGSELDIMLRAPIDEIARAGGEVLAEAVARLRRGQVRRSPGYDGEYGVVRLFEPDELGAPGSTAALFDLPASTAPPGQRRPAPPPAMPPAGAAQGPAGSEASAAGASAAASSGRAPRRRRKPTPPRPLAPAASAHRPWEPMLAGMEEVGTGLLDRLDALQRVAASAPGGPLLVVAGPGTGKTRTLTHRIAYLCAELGVPARSCLAITFTRRAADELRARLTVLLGEAAEQVTVSTFHALGLRLLRENAAAAGLDPGFAVADDAQRAALAVDGPDAYHKVLREQNLVDLDELTALPVAVLRDDPALASAYRDRWQWVFVDEYQDVDATQYDLLRLLVPPDGNICAIGDPDQAIYSFRGADVGYFLRFAEDFVDARMVRLARNYRSSAPIIAVASQAIAPTSLVRGRRLEPARLDPEAPLVGLRSAATVADEAEWVARTIDGLVGGLSHRSFDHGGVDSRAGTAEAISFADIAVLYRTDAQAAPIVDALARASVPVQKRSHDRLVSRRAVTAIARELRFVGPGSPPGDALPGGAALGGAALGDAALGGAALGGAALGGAALGGAAALGGSASGGLVERVRAVGRALASGRPRLFDLPPDPGLAGGGRRWGTPGRPDPRTMAEPVVLAEADVYSAVELLLPLAARCGDDLETFLQALATGAEVDAVDPRAQAVTLMTLHAAKGLEWPVVFLVGCEDGLLPLRLPGAARTGARSTSAGSTGAASAGASLTGVSSTGAGVASAGPADAGSAAEAAEAAEAVVAEERRLFFVGVTRAQRRLFLSHAGRRTRLGGEYRSARTPFLDPVDPGLLELLGEAERPAQARHRQLRLL